MSYPELEMTEYWEIDDKIKKLAKQLADNEYPTLLPIKMSSILGGKVNTGIIDDFDLVNSPSK